MRESFCQDENGQIRLTCLIDKIQAVKSCPAHVKRISSCSACAGCKECKGIIHYVSSLLEDHGIDTESLDQVQFCRFIKASEAQAASVAAWISPRSSRAQAWLYLIKQII